MTRIRKILIFGGSFSPPTLAHEAIIAACLSLPEFDEVWVMPSADRADKTIAMAGQDRVQMLELVKAHRFPDEPRLHISDFELRLPRPTQTHKTVRALQKNYQDAVFWFAFGADAYQDMPHWPQGLTLKRELQMVIFGSDPKKSDLSPDVAYLALPPNYDDISSTKARAALAAGADLQGLVSRPVAKYLSRL